MASLARRRPLPGSRSPESRCRRAPAAAGPARAICGAKIRTLPIRARAARNFARRAVIDAVAQPEDLRRRREMRPRQAGRRRHAVAGPGHAAAAPAPARPAAPASSKVTGASVAVGTIATGRLPAPRSRSAITPWRSLPALGRGPAIVDHQHQRAIARHLRRAAQQRIGQGGDQQRGGQQPQQQQPPGRMRRASVLHCAGPAAAAAAERRCGAAAAA